VSRISINHTRIEPPGLEAIYRGCVLLVIGVLTTFASPAAACECKLLPVCSYVGRSEVIFLGKATYSNDDGSGGFDQATLIRFEVEEAFKGLPADVHEVWIDPGSFTSCYAEYPTGEQYLVFASSKLDTSNVVAMTVIKDRRGLKPPPPGFDPSHPPMVYLANECSGTREISSGADTSRAGDLAFLRAWQKGQTTTRVYGHVLEGSRHGQPVVDPATDESAKVTLTGTSGKQTTVPDGNGEFSFDGLSPGRYSLDASMDGYRAFPPAVALDVAPGTCGYVDLGLVADGTLEGIVKDHLGHPAPQIGLVAQRLLPGGTAETIAHEITDNRGAFRFANLPSGDFQLGVNIDRWPSTDAPYAKSYYPGATQPTSIHLTLNEHRKGLAFNLSPPLKTRTVNVRVTWADSTPVPKAHVDALYMDGQAGELAQTDAFGNARLVCLSGVRYRLEANKWLVRPGSASCLAQSDTASLPEEPWTGVIKLVLAKASRGF